MSKHDNIVSKFEKAIELVFANGFTSPRVAVRDGIEISFLCDDDHRITTSFPMEYFEKLTYQQVFHDLMRSYQEEMNDGESDY